MTGDLERADIVMLGTFGVWGLGSLQARALPLARAIHQQHGLRIAIVTTPWDTPDDAGSIDVTGGVLVINTAAISPQTAPRAAREQVRWVDRLDPRIVHLFKPRGFGGLAAAYIQRRRPEFRVVVDTDDWEGDGGWNERNDYSLPQRRLFAWQEKSLVASADHVTAASRLLHLRARSLRTDPESVTLLPNGLERDWINQLRAGIETDRERHEKPTVLLYSRFAEFPGDWFARFAGALDQLVTRTVKLSLVGDPGTMQMPQPGANVEVEVHGFVARERLPGLLASATLAVYPYEDNLINRSKQSVKLLELMAAGCPVIASDVGDVAATLGSTGCMVNGSSPESFARATRDLLDRPAALEDMAARAQCRITDEFEISSLGARLADVYRGLGVTQPC